MRGGFERGFFDDALDGGVGALARRTARAIGDRDKSRLPTAPAASSRAKAVLPSQRSWAGRIQTTRRSGGCRRQGPSGSCGLRARFGGRSGKPDLHGQFFLRCGVAARWPRRQRLQTRGVRTSLALRGRRNPAGDGQNPRAEIPDRAARNRRSAAARRRASRAPLRPRRRPDRRDNAAPGGTAPRRSPSAPRPTANGRR